MERMLKAVPAVRANLSCTQCRFCGSLLNAQNNLMTICRRKPPVASAAAIQTGPQAVTWVTNSVWPAVNDADWCGDFEPAAQVS